MSVVIHLFIDKCPIGWLELNSYLEIYGKMGSKDGTLKRKSGEDYYKVEL